MIYDTRILYVCVSIHEYKCMYIYIKKNPYILHNLKNIEWNEKNKNLFECTLAQSKFPPYWSGSSKDNVLCKLSGNFSLLPFWSSYPLDSQDFPAFHLYIKVYVQTNLSMSVCLVRTRPDSTEFFSCFFHRLFNIYKVLSILCCLFDRDCFAKARLAYVLCMQW